MLLTKCDEVLKFSLLKRLFSTKKLKNNGLHMMTKRKLVFEHRKKKQRQYYLIPRQIRLQHDTVTGDFNPRQRPLAQNPPRTPCHPREGRLHWKTFLQQGKKNPLKASAFSKGPNLPHDDR